MRVVLALVVVSVYTGTVYADDFTIDIAVACPYLDMCSTPALNASTNSSELSCCHTCSCSDDCSYFGNCCYDKHFDVNTLPTMSRQRPKCLSQHELLNAPRNMTQPKTVDDLYYLITDTCHSHDAGNHTQEETDGSLVDYVMVSARDDARIFKNRRIALCNNVVDVVEWDLAVINCQDMLHVELAHLPDVIIAKCYIQFHPPAALADQVSEYLCSRNAISTCNPLYEGDQRVVHLCHSSTMFDNALFYMDSSVYANVYCFLCQDTMIGECTRQHRNSFTPYFPFVILIAVDQVTRDIVQQQYSTCKSFEIYDAFQERCIPQHCHMEAISIEGQCRMAFKYTAGHPLKLLFEVVAQPFDIIQRFPRDFVKRLITQFYEIDFADSIFMTSEVKEPKDELCRVCDTSLYTTAQHSIFFELTIATTAECGLEHALANTRRLQEMTNAFTVHIAQEPIRVDDIKLSDETATDMDSLSYTYYTVCYKEATVVTSDMLHDCPHVYVDLYELRHERHVMPQVISNISTAAIETNGSIIKICTDDYRAIYDWANSGTATVHVPSVLMVLFLCVVL